MGFQLVVGSIVVTLDRCFLDRSVHALDLAIGPWVADLGESVLDTLSPANTVKRDFPIAFGSFAFGELNAVVAEQSVNDVRYGVDQVVQEVSGHHARGLRMQFGVGEL